MDDVGAVEAMGCGGDAGTDVAVPAQRIAPGARPTCQKCKACPAVALSRLEPLCQPCFLEASAQRFRTAISIRICVRYGERVLVPFSGGPGSRLLLHFLSTALKRSGTQIVVLVVDTRSLTSLHSRVPGWADLDQREAVEGVLRIARESGHEYLYCGLESVYAPDGFLAPVRPGGSVCPVEPVMASPLVDQLNRLFAFARSTDAKVDLYNSLLRQLCLQAARQVKATKVLLASTANRSAMQAIEMVTKARGHSMSVEMSTLDWRHGDVSLCHPLRDVELKEVALCVRYLALDTVWTPSFLTMTSRTDSLGGLVEDFMATLQAGFPSTIHNVLRTAVKVKLAAPVARFVKPTREEVKEHQATALATAGPIQSRLCPVCADIMEAVGAAKSRSGAGPTTGPSDASAGEGDSYSHGPRSAPTAPCPTPLRDLVCPGCRRLLEECDPVLPSSLVPATLAADDGGAASGSQGFLAWGMQERARQRSALVSQFLLDSDEED